MNNPTSQSDSAASSGNLIKYAAHVFESEHTALEWLQSPVAALGQERPCDLWQTRQGREQIAQALRKIEFGEFS